jgi:hypothetical protein
MPLLALDQAIDLLPDVFARPRVQRSPCRVLPERGVETVALTSERLAGARGALAGVARDVVDGRLHPLRGRESPGFRLSLS